VESLLSIQIPLHSHPLAQIDSNPGASEKKIHKVYGAISGITTNPQDLLRHYLSLAELARLARETEQMLNIYQYQL